MVSCSEPRCPARGKATLLKLFRGPGYAYEVRSHGARDPFTAPHDALPFVRRRGRAAHLLPARLAELSDTDNGFSGPDAWYVTADANIAYARRAPNGGALVMPVLFFHALHDYVCETVDSRLAEPMRESCADLNRDRAPDGALDGAGAARACQRWPGPMARVQVSRSLASPDQSASKAAIEVLDACSPMISVHVWATIGAPGPTAWTSERQPFATDRSWPDNSRWPIGFHRPRATIPPHTTP